MDFGHILGPRGESHEMLLGYPEGSWELLGPRWSSRWPQEAPRCSQTTPKTAFGQIFNRLLLIRWLIFDSFGAHLGPILERFFVGLFVVLVYWLIDLRLHWLLCLLGNLLVGG